MTLKINQNSKLKLTTAQLKELCDQAEALGFDRGPNEQFWEGVDPNGIHNVSFWFVHRPNLAFWQGVDHGYNFAYGGGKNIRAEVMYKMSGTMTPCDLICDLDHDAFMKHVNHARRKARRNRRKKVEA